MHTLNSKTAWMVLGVVALAALGLIWWGLQAPLATPVPLVDGQTEGTTAAGTTQPGRTGGTQGSVPASSGSGSGSSQASTRDVTVQITGFSSLNPTVMPTMDYTLRGNIAGDTISIVGTAGEIVYLNQQPVSGTTYSLNLGKLTRADGTQTAIGPGEYFLRIRDKQGTILTQSGFFTVRVGHGELR